MSKGQTVAKSKDKTRVRPAAIKHERRRRRNPSVICNSKVTTFDDISRRALSAAIKYGIIQRPQHHQQRRNGFIVCDSDDAFGDFRERVSIHLRYEHQRVIEDLAHTQSTQQHPPDERGRGRLVAAISDIQYVWQELPDRNIYRQFLEFTSDRDQRCYKSMPYGNCDLTFMVQRYVHWRTQQLE